MERWRAIQIVSFKTRTCYVVLLPGEHNFRCTVVTSADVSRHLWVLDTCKTEITNLRASKTKKRYLSRLFEVGRTAARSGRLTFKSQFSFTRILLGFYTLQVVQKVSAPSSHHSRVVSKVIFDGKRPSATMGYLPDRGEPRLPSAHI